MPDPRPAAAGSDRPHSWPAKVRQRFARALPTPGGSVHRGDPRYGPVVTSLPVIASAPLLRVGATVRAGWGHSAWIGTWSVIGLIGTVCTPALLDRPGWLLLLVPRTYSVVLAARQLDLVEFILLGLFRLSVADPSYYLLGRRYAAAVPAGLRRPPRRLTRWLLGLLARSRSLALVVLFLRPNGRYLAVAGAQQLRAPHVGLAVTSGTLCYLFAVHLGVQAIG